MRLLAPRDTLCLIPGTVAGNSEAVLPSPNNSPKPSTYIAERNMPQLDELQFDFSLRQTHAVILLAGFLPSINSAKKQCS